MQVSISLPDHAERVRVSPDEAARLLVEAYGERATDQEIVGVQPAFYATWDEVDRLLAR